MSPRAPQPLDAQELDSIHRVLARFWTPLPNDVEVLGTLPGGISGVADLLHTVGALPVRDRREQLIFDSLELLFSG
jgi:hypothetical protein